jgi:hypothetical protein
MRTITQLTFESIIQMILQIRILVYYKNHMDDTAIEKYGVSINAIIASLLLAVSHAILEMVFLNMEA